MDIVNDEKSKLALEFKQLHAVEPRTPQISRRLDEIINFFIDNYQPFLFRKLTGVPKHDRCIIESTFRMELLYALLHWKGKSPVGGYIALCLKSVIRQFLIEKSPVHRQDVKGAVSYDIIAETIADREDSLGDNFRQFDIDIDEFADLITTEVEE